MRTWSARYAPSDKLNLPSKLPQEIIKRCLKNATDELYMDGGYSLGSYATRFYGLPRTFGLTYTQSFGGG